MNTPLRQMARQVNTVETLDKTLIDGCSGQKDCLMTLSYIGKKHDDDILSIGNFYISSLIERKNSKSIERIYQENKIIYLDAFLLNSLISLVGNANDHICLTLAKSADKMARILNIEEEIKNRNLQDIYLCMSKNVIMTFFTKEQCNTCFSAASRSFEYINHLSHGKKEANLVNRLNIWLYHKVTDSMNGYDFGDGVKNSIKDYKALSHKVAQNIANSTDPDEERKKKNEQQKLKEQEEEYYKVPKELTRKIITNVAREIQNEATKNDPKEPSKEELPDSDLFGF